MLEFKNVFAGYGKRTVLDGVDITFKEGAVSCIIGTNGCGKSTLIKTAVGIVAPSSGSVLLDGDELLSMKRADIAKRVAYLSQGRSVPDMTVGQIVLHGRFPHLGYPRHYAAIDREIAMEAMERVGISALSQTPLSELSGGMRQIAYVAMALAQQTDYILLDEPTTYLDIAHQLDLMRIMRSLANSGKGIVCVTHDLPLAFDFADEVILLDKGKVALRGAPKEVSGSIKIEEIFGVRVKCSPEENKFFYQYGGK